MEFESVNGVMNGYLKTYYENGKIERECNMKNGKQNGLTKFYDQNGEFKSEGYFKDGELLK